MGTGSDVAMSQPMNDYQQVQFEDSFSRFFVFWIFTSLHRYASQNKAREAVVVFYHN